MINVKNNNELSLMREAGKRTATILHMVASKVAPGVTTKELDEYAAELANQFKGKCAFNGYHGFSGNICSSINDEVVHGVPGKRVIRDGDIVSIDFGLIYDGYIGDTAVTVPAGNISQEWDNLLKVTKESLYAGINKAIEGCRTQQIIGAALETEVNYMPENEIVKNSLLWLMKECCLLLIKWMIKNLILGSLGQWFHSEWLVMMELLLFHGHMTNLFKKMVQKLQVITLMF